MHFLLKSALRSLSDNSQRARAVPGLTLSFPASTGCHQGSYNLFTQFPASKATAVTGCAVLRTPWYKANPGREAKGVFHRTAVKADTCRTCPVLHRCPQKAPPSLPSRSHSHTSATPASLQPSATAPEGETVRQPGAAPGTAKRSLKG